MYYLDKKARIYSARWNSNGNLIITASQDQRIKVLDFNGGCVLYTERTSDKRIYYL